jgi:hypothetical protein
VQRTPVVVIFPTPAVTSTPTPLPVVPLRIGVELEPAEPASGTEFSLLLHITNAGERLARGVYVATSGPWDRFDVVAIQPAGRLTRDPTGWHIVSPLQLAPGATETLEIRARSEGPSDDRVTFAVREAEADEWALVQGR